jgi:glycerol-3-phosphate dehydrogenase (NAD(P)+)
MKQVAVLGAGAWGTTLSILLAEKGHKVTLWVYEKDLIAEIREFRENHRFLPGFPLPESIAITGESVLPAGLDLAFFVAPTQFLRSVAKIFASSILPSTLVVSASKGIEEKSLKLPSEILSSELGANPIGVLSGPNLSQEIARGLPAAAVAAAQEEKSAKMIQEALMLERFRVYTNTDVLGVQLGGALKNVIAIAAGIVDGLNLGNNAKAGLMIRGLAEISRLGCAMGAKAETFTGLSGMGDLITTCSSPLSRNHQVGEKLAKGRKLNEILKEMRDVAEGIPTTAAALELGKKYRVDLPLAREVHNVMHSGKDPYRAITDLMTRLAKSELPSAS